MIFVAVGTQKFPFNRLVNAVDQLVESGVINEPVLIQLGHSTYQPKHCCSVAFMQPADFMQKIAECDLFITHCGVGSILNALAMQKKTIVVPRRKEFGEHVDNHQLEIGLEFDAMGLVVCCEEISKLEHAMAACSQLQPKDVRISYKNAGTYVEQYLCEQLKSSPD